MTWSVEATAPELVDELSRWLAGQFGTGADAPFLAPSLLRWKYFEPRPDAPGPRSWVLRDGPALLAHTGVWPVALPSASGPVAAAHLIDWAAAPEARGAGAYLYRQVAARYAAAVVAGGSAQARRVLPKLGFTPRGRMLYHTLPLRPWARLRNDRGPAARRCLRLARNAAWAAAGRLGGTRGWQAEPVAHAAGLEAPLPYLLRCPGVEVGLYNLTREGRAAGLAIVSFAGPQARIAEVRWRDAGAPPPEAWRALARALRRRADVHEAVAPALDGAPGTEALRAAGFHPRAARPVFLCDPTGFWTQALPPLSGLASDWFFLYTPGDPYLT